jgi:hypothetical protein
MERQQQGQVSRGFSAEFVQFFSRLSLSNHSRDGQVVVVHIGSSQLSNSSNAFTSVEENRSPSVLERLVFPAILQECNVGVLICYGSVAVLVGVLRSVLTRGRAFFLL